VRVVLEAERPTGNGVPPPETMPVRLSISLETVRCRCKSAPHPDAGHHLADSQIPWLLLAAAADRGLRLRNV
jgi:hypothetical protein